MVKAFARFLIAFLILLPGLVNAQEVEVSVDRTEIARGETLTLTIRVYQQQQNIQLEILTF